MAAGYCEMLTAICQIAQRHMPYDCNLNARRYEDQKFQLQFNFHYGNGTLFFDTLNRSIELLFNLNYTENI
jgi:hypothetical protein